MSYYRVKGEKSPRENPPNGDFFVFSHGDLSPRHTKVRDIPCLAFSATVCRIFAWRGERSPCENPTQWPFGGFSRGDLSRFRPKNTFIRHGINQPPYIGKYNVLQYIFAKSICNVLFLRFLRSSVIHATMFQCCTINTRTTYVTSGSSQSRGRPATNRVTDLVFAWQLNFVFKHTM